MLETLTGIAAGVAKSVDFLRNFLGEFDKQNRIPKFVWNLAAFGIGIAAAHIANLNILTGTAAAVHVSVLNAQTLTGLAIGGAASGWHGVFDFVSGAAKSRHADAMATEAAKPLRPGEEVDYGGGE